VTVNRIPFFQRVSYILTVVCLLVCLALRSDNLALLARPIPYHRVIQYLVSCILGIRDLNGSYRILELGLGIIIYSGVLSNLLYCMHDYGSTPSTAVILVQVLYLVLRVRCTHVLVLDVSQKHFLVGHTMKSVQILSIIVAGLFQSVEAFTSSPVRSRNHCTQLCVSSLDDAIENIKEDVQKVSKIIMESQQEGAGVKQILANVLAGEYDAAQVRTKVEALVNSAPCVIFTWKNSPSCKSAIQAMDSSGFEYTVIRLDNPWEEGNKIRAEIGKMVGRTSVPMTFIGGAYVGGFDGGTNVDDAPGLVTLAFQGRLQSMLEAAGAARK
jgi:glutaredoxin 3